MNKSIKEFYTKFTGKLVNDYLAGNKRIEEAILFSLQNIHDYGKNILDIGCGIGWSSHEFAGNFKECRVHGIDQSRSLIEIGEELFRQPNLKYQVFNIIEDKFDFDYKFNVVVMLDVYEHIPENARKEFHTSLLPVIEDNFKLILTCPTIYHQRYLRNYKPEGLQPIDEDVTIRDVLNIAEDLGAAVSSFQYKSIWRKNDYFHAVIESGSDFDPITKENKMVNYKLEKSRLRKKRVRRLTSGKNNE